MERSYIYLFVLFVNFYEIRYGDTVEQTTCTFSRSFRANDLGKLRSAQCMGRRGLLHWRESSGISVTDGIKINEQNKSIGIGPLYLQTESEAISLLLQKVMAGLNPVGYRTLQY